MNFVAYHVYLQHLHFHSINLFLFFYQWKLELEDILLTAAHDSEQWVSMVADILRPFPATGTLNLGLDESNGVFAEVNADLNKVGM